MNVRRFLYNGLAALGFVLVVIGLVLVVPGIELMFFVDRRCP